MEIPELDQGDVAQRCVRAKTSEWFVLKWLILCHISFSSIFNI